MTAGSENGAATNGAGLKLHRREDAAATDAHPPDAWRGDGTIFCSLLERMGRDVEPWALTAAIEALDALVMQLFADCRTDEVSPEAATWERVVLLATLLGYREVLSALAGRSEAIATRLVRRPEV
ncbi:hypothetical protein CA54_04250 [Symmachiella macrocystis]|uniref:Uncharacterized protein n=1 Tax=Symmachiella macrocystis TaxID=2527985 RepID=A0A5C6BIW9_9PLAN|nr:hypothetical protein [Symmachiella macrocystis]TWU11617.1 hypothetical protein CA54_04250 [Symmachiella macrocystis]